MAIRDKNHKIGSRGEHHVIGIFETLGHACAKISPDYGEDFFVYGESDGIIEPFKVFVQVKSSEQVDTVPSDWTVYEDPLTVRNWVLGNDLVVLVRHNLKSGETRFCIPEKEIVYWDIDPDKSVALGCTETFDLEAARALIWRARIRHYDRIVRITQPNEFEKGNWNEVPQFRLFILEFLMRLSLFDDAGEYLSDEVYAHQTGLTVQLLDDYDDSADMTAYEKARYAACLLLLLQRLQEVSGCEVGLSPFFLDQCACLLVQFVIPREDEDNGSASS